MTSVLSHEAWRTVRSDWPSIKQLKTDWEGRKKAFALETPISAVK